MLIVALTWMLSSWSIKPLFGNDSYLIEGFSRPNRIAEVASSTSGVVSHVLVAEGASVVEGECLYRLDAEVDDALKNLALATKESMGELNVAIAELRSAERRYLTIQGLASRDHSSTEELYRAQAAFEMAEANLQLVHEKQRLRLADYDKLMAQAKQYQISAPFDGIIVKLHREKGEFVGPADPSVCRLVQLSVLTVDFMLPSMYRKNLELHEQVKVHFAEANRDIVGHLVYIAPYPDAETGTYLVKVRIDNSDSSLNAGERCFLLMRDSGHSAPPDKSPPPGRLINSR